MRGVWIAILAMVLATAGAWAGEDQAPEYSNKLRWRTASEVENFGFDVYRGDSEDGPFERLTESPLPGAGTVDEPQEYEWIDRTIDPRKAYWYYVESISMSGVRERFTPVFLAKAKIKPDSEAEPEEPAESTQDETSPEQPAPEPGA